MRRAVSTCLLTYIVLLAALILFTEGKDKLYLAFQAMTLIVQLRLNHAYSGTQKKAE